MSRSDNNEPYASFPWSAIDTLFSAFLIDVLHHAVNVPGAEVFLYRDPSEPLDEFLYPMRDFVRFRELVGEKYSSQVRNAIDKTFAEGFQRVIVLLDNHPTLLSGYFTTVLEQLTHEDECIVVGPTVEGRCFLLGMKGNQSDLLENSVEDPLDKPQLLMERLCALDGVLFLTPQRYSINSGFNLARVREELNTLDINDGEFPARTFNVFKSFEKKYRLKHPAR